MSTLPLAANPWKRGFLLPGSRFLKCAKRKCQRQFKNSLPGCKKLLFMLICLNYVRCSQASHGEGQTAPKKEPPCFKASKINRLLPLQKGDFASPSLPVLLLLQRQRNNKCSGKRAKEKRQAKIPGFSLIYFPPIFIYNVYKYITQVVWPSSRQNRALD